MKLTVIFLILFLQACTESENTGQVSDVPADDPDDTTSPVSSCNKSVNLSSIAKPTGVFTSVITSGAVLNNTINGGLIRVTWADLETSPGVYDWSVIDDKLALLPAGKKWSLGILGGWSSLDTSDPELYDGSTYPNGDPRPTVSLNKAPPWLVSNYSVETYTMEFQKVTVYMTKYWDLNLQNRLQIMVEAVAARYKTDTNLQLVYVPQMTSNGIEGHFNGVPFDTLISAAGINTSDIDAAQQFEDIWVGASLTASKIVANAFDNKAIAFEVHDVIGRVSIPQRIMDGFLADPDFQNRAGIGMWWISGGTSYQTELVDAIKNYQGDVYGQVIGNSSQTYRYPNDDYTEVFKQAKELCMRYIEPWNYEFENNTFDATMTDFNQFASDNF